jgi:hypothetical protein
VKICVGKVCHLALTPAPHVMLPPKATMTIGCPARINRGRLSLSVMVHV